MPPKHNGVGKSSYDLIDPTTFMTALNLGEDAVLLDAACGAGNYAIEIGRRIGAKGKVVAFDRWEEGIDQLKRKAGALRLENIRAAVCDLSEKLPLENHSVDICLLATVLHHLVEEDSQGVSMKEILRVLKPNGRLAVVEFKKIPGPPGPPEKMRLSPEDLNKILTPMGFMPLDTVELGPATYLTLFQL